MSTSYLIDGIGDEVTVLLGVVVAIFVVIVSWLSTRVNDSNGNTERFPNVQTPQASENQQSENAPTQTSSPESDPAEPTSSNSVSSIDSIQNDVVTSNASTNDSPQIRQRIVNSTQAATETALPQEASSSNAPGSSTNITIRLKFMDETVQTVEVNPDDTLEAFMRQHFTSDTRNRYRLIYRGQVLRDRSRTLRQLNLVQDTNGETPSIPMVHCFLSPATAASEAGANMASSATQQMQMVAEELHIGSFLLPILGLALACLWYLCIFHTSLFSIQSIVSIVGFSFLYIALIVNTVM